MLRYLALGLVAGLRSLTPLAVVANALRRGTVAADDPVARLGRPPLPRWTAALAAAEIAGDKLPFAPDRTVAAGLAARVVTAAVATAAVAPRDERAAAALLGVAGSLAGAHVGLAVRRVAIRRYGRLRSGAVEDALAVGAALLIVHALSARATAPRSLE